MRSDLALIISNNNKKLELTISVTQGRLKIFRAEAVQCCCFVGTCKKKFHQRDEASVIRKATSFRGTFCAFITR